MKDQDLETKSNIPHSNQTTVLLHNRLTNKLIKPKRKKKKKKKLSIKIETTWIQRIPVQRVKENVTNILVQWSTNFNKFNLSTKAKITPNNLLEI